MNIKITLIASCAAALLAGCASDDKMGEETFLSDREQKAALAKSKSPQFFGFAAFPLPDGEIGFNGTARLHPNHLSTVDFVKGPYPVVQTRGTAPRKKINTLIDTSAANTWMDFASADEFGAVFLGMNDQSFSYRGASNTGGVNAFAAVVSQMRFDQLFIENIPVYVRMSSGALGPQARGVLSPNVEGVLGWDLLQEFEYVQFYFQEGKVTFSSTIPYVPHNDLVMTEAKIVKQRGFGLAVEGGINGVSTPIVLDVAGDFHFARGDVKVNQTKQVSLGDVVYRKVPTLLLPPNSSPPRAGRLMLEKYVITVCPKIGVVYFERLPE